ncbi:MAG: hypothetical protein PHU80_03950 [Kiritimatiellae bacterium]|nr:hypothetical protein [Kiritimatiellia bacterium]
MGEDQTLQKPEQETYVYRINADDVIVWVGDNWQAFVEANKGAANTAAKAVLGKSLYDYICGLEVRHLYATVLKVVRERNQVLHLLFRCDAPELRRYLRLELAPLTNGHVELRSQILKTESRESVELLRPDLPRSDEIITMCSMCKKVETDPDDWQEIESAINRLHLFEMEAPPQISHGLCPVCYQAMLAEIG